MVRIWLTETEQEIILAALESYKADAENEGQWRTLINAIDRTYDNVFHAGEDDE